MLHRERLKQAIDDSGLKKGYIAKKIGLTRAGLRNCMTGKAEFRESQMRALSELLKLDNEQKNAIFFAPDGG